MKAIVLSMFGDLDFIIRGQDGEVLRDINDLENELDRFYFLIISTKLIDYFQRRM